MSKLRNNCLIELANELSLESLLDIYYFISKVPPTFNLFLMYLKLNHPIKSLNDIIYIILYIKPM